MLVRALLVCQAGTAAQRSGTLPTPDDPPLATHLAQAAEAGWAAAPARVVCSSTAAARATAGALGLDDDVDEAPALGDADLGRWAGRPVAALVADEPEALAAWLSDPLAAPHGGEAAADVVLRVGGWLAGELDRPGTVVAVLAPWCVRAAVASVLGGPTAFPGLDVAPLTVAELRADGRRWTLRSFGRPLRQTAGPGAPEADEA